MSNDSLTRAERKRRLQEHIRVERRAVLVVNARSRQGAKAYRLAKDLLQRRGFTLDAAFPVRDPARLEEVVRGIVALNHRLIIIGGGDGTLSSIVDVLANREVVLGLLPLGTANSFARELGIPLRLKDAIDTIVDGRVADVDLALVNDDYFVNTAVLGLPAAVARATPHLLKKYLGKLAYLLVGTAKFFSYRSFQCRVIAEGRSMEFDALQVLLANGRYLGGVLTTPNAGAESRDILIQIMTGRSKWNLVRSWIAVILRRKPAPGIITELTVQNALIETDPAQYISIDGEVASQTPMRLAVAHEALNVMVPLSFDDRD